MYKAKTSRKISVNYKFVCSDRNLIHWRPLQKMWAFSLVILNNRVKLTTGYELPIVGTHWLWMLIDCWTKIQHEEDNFGGTPSVGYGLYSIKEFSGYDAKETVI